MDIDEAADLVNQDLPKEPETKLEAVPEETKPEVTKDTPAPTATRVERRLREEPETKLEAVPEETKPEVTKDTPAPTATRVERRLREELEGKSPMDRLQTIMMEIADESEALRDIRQKAQDLGDADPSAICARRVTALKEMGNLIIQLDKLGLDVNLDHPILEVMMSYLLDKFISVLRSNGITQAQTDVILSSLYADIKEWEKEVDVRYRAHCKDKVLQSDRERDQKAEKKDKDRQREQLKAVS